MTDPVRSDPWAHGSYNWQSFVARPARRLPTLKRIAQFHGLGDEPACYGCGYVHPGTWTWATAGAWLDRAHVIDRCYGGLDNEPNLRPLCSVCHRAQPIFAAGDEIHALAWLASLQCISHVGKKTPT